MPQTPTPDPGTDTGPDYVVVVADPDYNDAAAVVAVVVVGVVAVSAEIAAVFAVFSAAAAAAAAAARARLHPTHFRVFRWDFLCCC